jgi:WD40 repeat protein
MKKQPITSLDPRTTRTLNLMRWSAFLSCAMVLGCDKTLLVGSDDISNMDVQVSSNAIDSGVQTSITSATGGTAEIASKGGAGGASGLGGMTTFTITPTTATTTVATTCAPIATATGVLNPCGHSFGVAYSPDGQILAVGSDSETPSVHLWQLSDGMPLHNLDIQTIDTTYNLAFSPDGKTLATAGYLHLATGNSLDDSDSALVRLWNVSTGALIRSFAVDTGFYADTVAFSHDGIFLATGGYWNKAEVWRVADGTRVLSIPVPTSVHNVHFSPDDSQLIVATVDGVVKIWDVATGKLILDTITTTQEMADADFSPDGKQIASTGDGNVIRLWNATTSELLQTLGGHAAYISHVVWVDQNRLLSDDWSGVVILWTRGDSGTFAATTSWSTGGQALGIAVSPDKTKFVTGGGTASQDGFVFLSL